MSRERGSSIPRPVRMQMSVLSSESLPTGAANGSGISLPAKKRPRHYVMTDSSDEFGRLHLVQVKNCPFSSL